MIEKKKRKSRAKTIEFQSKDKQKVVVREKDFKKFLGYVSQAHFCKVTIEVENDGVLCTYETESGTGKAVLQNLADK